MPNIERFKGSFNQLARPNRFRIYGFQMPTDLEMLGKGSTLPSTNVGAMDINYQGRIIKSDGDRTYEDFTFTVYGDDTMRLRRELEAWSNVYNDPIANAGVADKRDGTIQLLGRDDSVSIEFKIFGAVITNIGQVDLDWGTNDTPLEFPITLAYDYHLIVG